LNNNHQLYTRSLVTFGDNYVAPITIAVGIVLMVLGPIGWFAAEEVKQSWTAFIPSIFGIVLLGLGVLALQEKMRKHAMHAAVIWGLFGFIAAAARVVPAALGGEIHKNPLAFTMQLVMAVVCGVFVVLCVKSFIDARRRRQAQ
jgi:hypothetical protein